MLLPTREDLTRERLIGERNWSMKLARELPTTAARAKIVIEDFMMAVSKAPLWFDGESARSRVLFRN